MNIRRNENKQSQIKYTFQVIPVLLREVFLVQDARLLYEIVDQYDFDKSLAVQLMDCNSIVFEEIYES